LTIKPGGLTRKPTWQSSLTARYIKQASHWHKEIIVDEITSINDESFEIEVLQAELPVLVDFTAASCAPCKNQDPVVADLAANEWAGRLKVVKLDTDQYPATAVRCRVLGLPTLLLFKGGKEVVRLTGSNPKKRLLDKINPHL